MQKCIKLKIIKPYEDDSTWDVFGKVLRDTSYNVYRMSNYVMREAYLNAINRLKDIKEKLYCYPFLSKEYENVPGHIVNAVERGSKSIWSAHAKAVLRSEESLPNFKRNIPIPLHNKSYKILYDEEMKSYFIDAQLCSNKVDKTRYKFVIAPHFRDKSAMCLLNKLVSGEIKHGDAHISLEHKKWYMIIPYKIEVDPDYYDIDKDKIMGIDLGVVKAAYWAFNDSLKRGYIDGGEIEKFRKTVRARRIEIQRQYPYSGRHGHGVSRALLPTKKLESKESNFKDLCNFRYASYIVKQALRNHCGIIQMEDLKKIAQYNSPKFLKNWTYYDLRMKIVNKAAEYGIEVRFIDPQYTSQRCSCCGHIEKENRPDQATFVCQKCGYGAKYICPDCGHIQDAAGKCEDCGATVRHDSVNADFNAARNISIPGIEDIIANKLEELDIKPKHKKCS